jgi:hypothetical protein
MFFNRRASSSRIEQPLGNRDRRRHFVLVDP